MSSADEESHEGTGDGCRSPSPPPPPPPPPSEVPSSELRPANGAADAPEASSPVVSAKSLRNLCEIKLR